MRLYMGLVHFPVYNKHQDTIASAITPLDIHDFARLGKTYGTKGFFVITPLEDQQTLVFRILRHWTTGYGARYNRHRKEAMDLVSVTSTLEEALLRVADREGETARIVATDAVLQKDRDMSYKALRRLVLSDEVILLLFGTAWGLHKDLLDKADHVLEPIFGKTEYNHLSVRTAAAVILDRLVGRSNRLENF
ncbi:MAG: RNA methyltransferase [Deltaproteobacteria bacterium]|nr:RNA methyltransferase [Deltaproteobacteria bacterium]